jgi:hypothetical protein
VPTDGLDAEKVQVLGRWAAGLRGDERAELAAAGRAIELLIEEIERLHVLLWARQLYPEQAVIYENVAVPASEAPESDPEPEVRQDEDVGATLRRRLAARFHSERPSHP